MATAAQENVVDSLASLEDRISRAVEVVARLRSENQELQDKLLSVTGERDAARQELESLRAERKQVRTRIEKLLGQMDLLSTS